MERDAAHAAALLCSSARALAAGTVQRQILADPNTVARYGTSERALREDTEVRFGYLAEAVGTKRPALFAAQLSWLKILCVARGTDPELLRENVETMIAEVIDRLPDAVGDLTHEVASEALADFDTAPVELPSFLAAERPHVDLARRVLLAILEMREREAISLMEAAFEQGTTLRELIELVVIPVQQEIGRMWHMAEATIAEEHYCTHVLSSALTILRAKAVPTVELGTRALLAAVGSETHDFGIRLVSIELEQSGWQTLYLGAGTPARAIVEAVRDFQCDLIALSANIVLHVRPAAHAIELIRSAPESQHLPILVGGQPFQLVPDLWKVVGADATAGSLAECSAVAASLVGLEQTR